MANKYANLVGINKIKDEYTKINTGFDEVEADINALDARVDTIITTPIEGAAAAQEIVDARVSAVKSKTFATLDARFEESEQDLVTHKADYANNAIKKDGSTVMTGHLGFINNRGVSSKSGDIDSFLNIDFPDLNSAAAHLRLFRATNTGGHKRIDIHNGDGTSGMKIQILNGEITALNGVFLKITAGTGSPEGVVDGQIGSLYLRTDAGELYVKKISTGNTGWGKVTVA